MLKSRKFDEVVDEEIDYCETPSFKSITRNFGISTREDVISAVFEKFHHEEGGLEKC